jgi:hypothetical protein
MDVVLAKKLINTKPEDLKTELARKSLIEIKEVLDLYLTVHWVSTAADMLSVPSEREIAFVVTFSENETYDARNEITGVNSTNYKEKLVGSVRWLTPMVFVSVISILEDFLEGLREIPAIPTNQNVFTRLQAYLSALQTFASDERETGRQGAVAALGILSDLKRRRNEFIHRRDNARKPRRTTFTIDDPINAILHGLYILLVLDDFLDIGQFTQIS